MRSFFLAALLLASPLCAEVGITAPVKDFRLPMFSPAGAKVWELRGGEGVRKAGGVVELRSMLLRFFDNPTSPQATAATGQTAPTIEIRSPVAVVHEKERVAEGPERIEIQGPAYSITGSDWRFEGAGQNRRVLIRKDVRVSFSEQLDSILK